MDKGISKLVYNESIVGYRIKYLGDYFDISKDLFDRLNTDLKGFTETRPINLYTECENGKDLLVAEGENGKTVPELTEYRYIQMSEMFDSLKSDGVVSTKHNSGSVFRVKKLIFFTFEGNLCITFEGVLSTTNFSLIQRIRKYSEYFMEDDINFFNSYVNPNKSGFSLQREMSLSVSALDMLAYTGCSLKLTEFLVEFDSKGVMLTQKDLHSGGSLKLPVFLATNYMENKKISSNGTSMREMLSFLNNLVVLGNKFNKIIK